jgi:RES domain-containing protein
LTVTAWRIVKAKHARHAFTGEAARRSGGRWNSRGTSVVYAASSVSLAILEILVHLDTTDLLDAFALIEVSFDETLVEVVDFATLPDGWRRHPPPRDTQAVGDLWVARATSAVLKAPSAIVPTEPNYLLNPAHVDFGRIAIAPPAPLSFDPRLLRRREP